MAGCPSTAYQRPDKGILSYLPLVCVPYAELIRLSKPTGVFNIYFPYLFGILYAACRGPMNMHLISQRSAELLIAAFVLRSLGCSWNDIIDRNIDRQVSRSRHRPMARGAISMPAALLFTGLQYFLWIAILSTTLPNHWHYSIPLMGLVLFYPFAKRITYHAQAVLGITLAFGVPLGSSAMGDDPFRMRHVDGARRAGLMALYLSYVLWSVIHDTVYAQQDIRDDLKIGVRSMAVYYRHRVKTMLLVTSLLLFVLHIYTGMTLGAHIPYQVLTSVGSSAIIAWMLWKVNLNDPDDCGWWFRNGSIVWGILVAAGLFTEAIRQS